MGHGISAETTLSAALTTPAPSSTLNAPPVNEQVQAESENLNRMKDLLVLVQTLRAHTTVLKRIPKAARIHTAIEFSNLIAACIRPNATFLSWAHFFTFSYTALKSPDKKDKSTKNLSIATIVKRNLDLWTKLKRLPFEEFSNKILSNLQRRKKSKTAKDMEAIRLKLVQAKLSDGDISGAIRILSSNDTIAVVNAETHQKLLEKHPEPNLAIEVENATPADIQPVSSTEVRKSIFAFATGSSGGMDGIKPQHLKDLIGKETGDHGEKVLECLSGFSDFCLNGEVPTHVTHLLYGATLCGLNKKDNTIRPIAIGNTVRRLVSRIASSRISERMGNELRPKQLGYGTHGGCEAGVHAARHFVNFDHESIKVLAKLDFRNAYNEIERHPMLQATKEKCPEIFPFMRQCYAQPSWLSFGDFGMLSQRGCQQGDPCGPAIFCLSIHDMILALTAEFNIWYMDDGSIGGSPDTVLNDLKTIIDKSADLGLQLNFTKCEIKILGSNSHNDRTRILEQFNEIAPGIIDRPDDIELLGSPLTIAGIRSAIQRKIEKLKLMVQRLDKLNSHHSYCLMRSSLTIPQLNYLLRTTPCWLALDMLEEYDRILKTAMEGIVNCNFSVESWDEATLPVKLGGLGLRNATTLCYSSFLGSIHSVSDLVQTIVPSFSLTSDSSSTSALVAWSTSTQSDILPENERKFQHKWDTELCSKQQQRLLEKCVTDSSKARILANNCKESGAWLNAFPFSSLGTLLDDQAFRIAVSLRLGIPLCVPHTCVCGEQVDELGHHGLCCKKSGGRYARHAMTNDLLKRSLITCKIPAILEPTGCNRSDGKKPDGLTLVPWQNGKPLVWDFTCADTLARSYVNRNSKKPGSAAQTRESYKRTLYRNLEANFHFVPICVETLGTFGEDGLKLVKRIGELMRNVTGEKRSTSFLIQRISVAVQRGNAAAILGTVPSESSLDEIFYL